MNPKHAQERGVAQPDRAHAPVHRFFNGVKIERHRRPLASVLGLSMTRIALPESQHDPETLDHRQVGDRGHGCLPLTRHRPHHRSITQFPHISHDATQPPYLLHPTSKSREFLGPMSGKASLPVGWLMAARRVLHRQAPNSSRIRAKAVANQPAACLCWLSHKWRAKCPLKRD